MEWSEGGRGSGTTHLGLLSPVSIHAHSLLFVSRGGCFGWWWFARIMVRGSWVMVKGTCCHFGDRDGGGSSLLGGHHCLWAVGGHCGCLRLCP